MKLAPPLSGSFQVCVFIKSLINVQIDLLAETLEVRLGDSSLVPLDFEGPMAPVLPAAVSGHSLARAGGSQ